MNTFNVNDFLATIGEGRTIAEVTKKEIIYAQGAACNALFYILEGKVTLTVLSTLGKEATTAILGEGDLFGEGCIAGQSLRMGSATALTDCKVMRIESKAVMLALHRDHTLSDLFTAYLLGRNKRISPAIVRADFHEIVRQQWNFTSPEATCEIENYQVELSDVTVAELVILPDKNRGASHASLEESAFGLIGRRC